jgi:hypothetical protein
VVTHVFTSKRLLPARAATIATLRSGLGARYEGSLITCSPFQYTFTAPPAPTHRLSGRAVLLFTNVSANAHTFSNGRITAPNGTKPLRTTSGTSRQLTGRSRPW